jgi:GT2 family glycosyltransferase
METNSGGPASPINRGVRLANSKWIYVLDQDDLMSVDALTHFSRCLKDYPEVEVIGGIPYRFVDYNSNLKVPDSVLSFWPDDFPRDLGDAWLVTKESLDFWLKNGMFLNGFPGFYFKKASWNTVGGVDESYKIAADFDFALKLSKLFDILILKKTIYHYRYHEKNLSANKQLILREDLRAKMSAYLSAGVVTQRKVKQTMLESVYKNYYWSRKTGNYETSKQALMMHRILDGPILTHYRLNLYLRLHSIASYIRSRFFSNGRVKA